MLGGPATPGGGLRFGLAAREAREGARRAVDARVRALLHGVAGAAGGDAGPGTGGGGGGDGTALGEEIRVLEFLATARPGPGLPPTPVDVSQSHFHTFRVGDRPSQALNSADQIPAPFVIRE